MRQLLPQPKDPIALDELFAWPPEPAVRLSLIGSLDGAATIAGRSGPLSSPADRAVFSYLRQSADAVIVGAATARAERYRQLESPKLLAIVSQRAELDPASGLFQGDNPPLIFAAGASASNASRLAAAGAEVILAKEEEIDLGWVVAELRSRGCQRITCEGGPTVASSMIRLGLIDEACLTLAPLFVGSAELRLLSSPLPTPVPAHIEAVGEEDGWLFLRAHLRT